MYIDESILKEIVSAIPRIPKKRTYSGISWDPQNKIGVILILNLEGDVVLSWKGKISHRAFMDSIEVLSISRFKNTKICICRNLDNREILIEQLYNRIQKRRIFAHKNQHRSLFSKVKRMFRVGSVNRLGVNFSRKVLIDYNSIIEEKTANIDPSLKFLYGVTLTALVEDKKWKNTLVK